MRRKYDVMSRGLIIAIVVALIVVALAWYYYTYLYGVATFTNLKEGSFVTLACDLGNSIEVMSATYTPPGRSAVDVTSPLQGMLKRLRPAQFTVGGAMFGQPAGGALTFSYRCSAPTPSKSGFVPIPMSPCAVDDDEYGVDMTSRNAAGTVEWIPWSEQSRVSLERGAETPEVATMSNPVTGIGKTSMVRKLGDRYRRNEELSKLTVWDTQPGDPGYMEPIGDGFTTVNRFETRGASGKPPVGCASCSLIGSDTDTDYYTDGFYGDAVLSANGAPRNRVPIKTGGATSSEGFTTSRAPYVNSLVASRTGLGSVRQDPRFEPGPDQRIPGGDASWAPGDWAGGPTSGALAPAVFAPPSNWYTTYVAGFGDPNDVFGTDRTAEVVDTEAETLTR